MITKITNAAYDPQATCPTWERFLEQIMADGRPRLLPEARDRLRPDRERARARGVPPLRDGIEREDDLPGDAALRARDYACGTPSETFMAKAQANGQSNDLARLRGTRFVTASETEDGQRLAEVLIKKISGGTSSRRASCTPSSSTSSRSSRSFWHESQAADQGNG